LGGGRVLIDLAGFHWDVATLPLFGKDALSFSFSIPSSSLSFRGSLLDLAHDDEDEDDVLSTRFPSLPGNEYPILLDSEAERADLVTASSSALASSEDDLLAAQEEEEEEEEEVVSLGARKPPRTLSVVTSRNEFLCATCTV